MVAETKLGYALGNHGQKSYINEAPCVRLFFPEGLVQNLARFGRSERKRLDGCGVENDM
jgi:hypothetical protein